MPECIELLTPKEIERLKEVRKVIINDNKIIVK